MSKVRFCIEEDSPYSLERLEKVLGRDFWYRDEELRIALEKFIENPDIKKLKELLKRTPHAPVYVYNKNELESFQPHVLLITNEPGLNDNVIRNLYLRPTKKVVEALYEHSECVFGYQAYRTVLKEITDRFNLAMFSWLTLTYLPELKNEINGDPVKPIRNDCRVLQNITSHNDQDDLKKIAYCLKKISYWILTHESILEQLEQLEKKIERLEQLLQQQSSPSRGFLDELKSLIENLQRLQLQQSLLQSLEESIERLLELLQQQSSRLEESQRLRRLIGEMQQLKQLLQQLKQQLEQSEAIFMVNMWLDFIKKEEPKVIHWDLLPYSQYINEKNYINDKISDLIKEVTGNNPSSQIFKEINEKIKSEVSCKQSLWYVKLLDKFLEAFKEVNIEEGRFFILVVGNKIIKKKRNDNYEKDRREILGHLFAGLYKENPNIRNAIVIFRNKWCSCNDPNNPRDYPANLYFVKFDKFLDNNGNFSWSEFENVLQDMNQLTQSTYYGGKNKIPCY